MHDLPLTICPDQVEFAPNVSLYLPSHRRSLPVQNKVNASLFQDEGARGTQNAALASQISRVAAELGEYHGEI